MTAADFKRASVEGDRLNKAADSMPAREAAGLKENIPISGFIRIGPFIFPFGTAQRLGPLRAFGPGSI